MAKSALLLGSIGVIAETSDIQRRAYNQALREAGLDWNWDRDTYAELLEQAGGKERLAMLSAATATGLTQAQIDTIHARKTELACAEIAEASVRPRPGIVALLRLAKTRSMKTAFVTTTYRPNIDAIFAAFGDTLRPEEFDYIGTRAEVVHGKPAPDAYRAALVALGVSADDALAVEDTAVSLTSSKRAGIVTVATPGDITAGQDFWQADLIVDALADAQGSLDPRVLALLD